MDEDLRFEQDLYFNQTASNRVENKLSDTGPTYTDVRQGEGDIFSDFFSYYEMIMTINVNNRGNRRYINQIGHNNIMFAVAIAFIATTILREDGKVIKDMNAEDTEVIVTSSEWERGIETEALMSNKCSLPVKV